MPTPVLTVRNLTKKIGDKVIVNRLHLDLYPGEIFGFLGPNGAGKTTVIRLITGLMSPTEGDIFIDGHNLKTHRALALSRVGAIVENPEFYPFLSGYHNLLHYARMSDHVSRDRIREVVRMVGLGDSIDDKVKTYSLGMRQRLGIAQALLHSPKILILDEPTNGLDPAGIRNLRDDLRRLVREENLSILVSSHILAEMEAMCDRFGILKQGEWIEERRLNDWRGNHEEHERTVFFFADPLPSAEQILRTLFPERTVHVEDDRLRISLKYEQIPEANAELVKSGIRVYEIRTENISLEDRYLSLTGGVGA
ncbi:ABC transporter ATP-binding protein [Staphylospora marina]|uniref:ABC transporter ATP-binding protein n=1 Tax=Staphylospora marina TaxID=2490858 RepID=UPI000F5C259A|nr:ABC transporter ATP-binding protein [Staphylospora marina]